MLWKNGSTLVISLLFCSCACAMGKKVPEPTLEWCSMYSDGAAECRLKDGTFKTRMPSELEGYLAMPVDDAETYRKYCTRRKD